MPATLSLYAVLVWFVLGLVFGFGFKIGSSIAGKLVK